MTFVFNQIDVVALIGALVVPFLSVLAAQSLVRQDSKRKDVMSAIQDVNRHVLTYAYNFMDRHPANFVAGQSAESNTVDVPPSMTRSLVDSTTELNNDVLTLGILLGNEESKPIGRIIQKLIGCANMLLSNDPHQIPPPLECKAGLDRDIQELHKQMKIAWDKINNRPPWKLW